MILFWGSYELLKGEIWFNVILSIIAESTALFSAYTISYIIRYINQEGEASLEEGGMLLALFGGTQLFGILTRNRNIMQN